MNRKHKLIALLILILFLIFFGIKAYSSSQDKKNYDIAKITKRNIIETVEASGTISPVTSTQIGSQVSGQIQDIYVDYNSIVKKGQLLAQIDPTLYISAVNKAKASLLTAESNYNKVKANVIYNKANYGRYARLYKKHYVSKDEVESSYTKYIASEAELAALQGNVNAARAELKTAEANLGYTKIYSPMNGTVITKSVTEGQTVQSSYQTPELFEIAEDLSKMQIEVTVSEADIDAIVVDQKVQYSVDTYPDTVFEGIVTEVRLQPTTVSNVTTYTVIVNITNENEVLKPGMTANCTFITAEKKDVLTVPNTALKYVPKNLKERYTESGIWVLKNNKQVRIPVKIGIKDSDFSEIISTECEEGMKVLTPKSSKGKNQFRRRGPLGF